ncbi:MAG: hypothetical protein AAGE84_21550 [Cyanobacteria bacterium P01_G01_bin.39]
MPWWWIPALIMGVTVVRLTWGSISNWFSSNKKVDTAYGEIVRQKLTDGNYTVVTNVFSNSGQKTASRTWEAGEIDSTLSSKLGNRNVIRIDI